MKKELIVIFVCMLFVGAVLPVTGTVINNDIKPISSINSNILYVGGTGEGNYTHIQDAINDSVDGDTVFVYDDSSPYYENLIVNKSIKLIGENKETTVIDGRGLVSVVYITGESACINDFTIQNGGSSFYNNNAGVKVGAKYVVISDNVILNNGNFGITIEQKIILAKSYTTISNNIITNNSNHGIYLNSRYNTISENIISENKDGIVFLSDSDYNTIISNIIKDNNKGIILHGHRYDNCNTITSNIIQDNNNGIILATSNSNKIEKNTITNNGKYGILLEYEDDSSEPGEEYRYTSSNNIVSSNFIGGHKYGIKMELECDNNMIYNNNINGNTWGLYTDVSGNNNIEKNNFIGNTRNAYFKTFRNYDICFDQNYWDDWYGISMKIIIGKRALFRYQSFYGFNSFWFFIPWFNLDRNPAKEPYVIDI